MEGQQREAANYLQDESLVGVAGGEILNHWLHAFLFIQQAASRRAA